MCNFYFMYFTKNDGKSLYEEECWSSPPRSLHFPTKLPPLPSHPANREQNEEEEEHHHHSHAHQTNHASLPSRVTTSNFAEPVTSPVLSSSGNFPSRLSSRKMFPSEDWPLNGIDIPDAAMGQVSAAAVDASGGVHVLHRGPVTWDMK